MDQEKGIGPGEGNRTRGKEVRKRKENINMKIDIYEKKAMDK